MRWRDRIDAGSKAISEGSIMHDLDRVSMQREGEFEGENFEFVGAHRPHGGGEFEGENFEFVGAHRHHGGGEGEGEGESPFARSTPLRESEAAELGAELLAVSSDRELEQFLGNVVGRAVRAVGGAVDSPTGQAVIRALKPIAKAAIPDATSALGGAAGGAISDGAGEPIGAAIGQWAGDRIVQALGLELEGVSHEDRELEVAKQVVRLVASTAANAADAPPHVPPHVVAQTALANAARHLTPGLLAAQDGGPGLRGGPAEGGASSGRWFRRGGKIILVGV
jgi:hypothetical protein